MSALSPLAACALLPLGGMMRRPVLCLGVPTAMPKRCPRCSTSSGTVPATPLVATGPSTGSTPGSPASGGAQTSCPPAMAAPMPSSSST
eukprot:14152672-Alexandrium_andersonii.AAC.1